MGLGWGWDGVSGLVRFVQKCNFWKVLGLARNPSKKMRLDESSPMVQSAFQSMAYIKSYGQKTKVIAHQNLAHFRNCNVWLRDPLVAIIS